jgi:hypothetical protein
MKRVRLAMLVASMFLGITTVSRAQDTQPQGRPSRGNQAAVLFKDITLTEAQTAKRDSIVAKYREQQQAIRAEMQGGGDRDAAMGKLRDLSAKQREEFKAILTDEQKKVFDKNAEEMQQRMQQRPPSGL